MIEQFKKLFNKQLFGKQKLSLIVTAIVVGLVFYAVGVATNFFASPIFSPFFIISAETAHSVAAYAALFVAINLVLVSLAVYYLRQNNDSIEEMLTDTGAKVVPTANITDATPITVNIQPENEKSPIQPVAEITPVSPFTNVTVAKPLIASAQVNNKKTNHKTVTPVTKPIVKRMRKGRVLKQKIINEQKTQILKLKRHTNKKMKKTLPTTIQRKTNKGLRKPNRQTIAKRHINQKFKKPSKQIVRKPKVSRRVRNSLRRTGFTPRANMRLKKSSRRAKNNLKIRKPAKLVSNRKKIVNLELEQPVFITSDDPTNLQLEELWNRLNKT